MARNQEPVTDEELEALREEMEAQREDVREALAEDLGGDPDDYHAERYFRDLGGDTDEAVPDGGASADDDGE